MPVAETGVASDGLAETWVWFVVLASGPKYGLVLSWDMVLFREDRDGNDTCEPRDGHFRFRPSAVSPQLACCLVSVVVAGGRGADASGELTFASCMFGFRGAESTESDVYLSTLGRHQHDNRPGHKQKMNSHLPFLEECAVSKLDPSIRNIGLDHHVSLGAWDIEVWAQPLLLDGELVAALHNRILG